MEPAVLVRPGRRGDVPELTDLYNYYVATSPATFDDVPFTLDQRLDWFAHYDTRGPHRVLVAVEGDRLLGYATSSPFRPKPGYRTSVETTVYVAPDAVGRGVGNTLYGNLFAALSGEGLHRAYAGVAVPNPASRALHLRNGFEPIGTFREVGTKFGGWIDVEWLERVL